MLRLAVAIAVCTVALALPPTFVLDPELDRHWELFKGVNQKNYQSNEEETLRRLVWEGHLKYIASHNREYDMGLHTYYLGVNEYADMSNEEFVVTMNGYRGDNKTRSGIEYMPPSNVEVPASADWRGAGYVTPVKNQGRCGSCWAFSTTGALEGQHFRSRRTLVSLSEQNLVDCSRAQGNQGCQGGNPVSGFRYIQTNGGIDTEQSYPYTAQNGACHYRAAYSGATDRGFVNVGRGDENALKSAAGTVGPISVAIDASRPSFQLYRGGVYNDPGCSSTQLDHAVLVVGYGSDSGRDFWLVKNSWGSSWGVGGYIYMSRNRNNQCGIASSASYPLV